jgi:hypothetical protein
MIDSQHATDILDVKSCRGADCDSDHYMVKIEYRQRISITGKSKGQRSSKFDKDKLKNGLTAREYRNKIENFLQTPSNIEDQTVETMWKYIKHSIHKAS